MRDSHLPRTSAITIFCVLTSGWLFLAKSIPIWNDEVYSQDRSIQNLSYASMFSGKIPEGNRTPLFYFMQKLTQDTIGYKWPGGYAFEPLYANMDGTLTHLASTELFANLILRLLPVACMAAGVSVIYYYFSVRWNMWLGAYSLLLSLSSFMVWEYAFHARPYALWFCLTSFQIYLFLGSIEARTARRNHTLVWLTFVHWLLSLTVIFSAVQIIAACIVLWVFGERRLIWQTLMSVGPIFITLGYFIVVPHANIFFVDGPMALLFASLPLDRISIIAIGLFVIGASALFGANPMPERIARLRLVQAATSFLLLIYCGCLLVLLKFKIDDPGFGDSIGTFVSNRYFIVLTPVGIVMTSIASYYILTLTKGYYKIMGGIFLCALMLLRFSRTFDLVILRRLSGN